VHFKEGVSHLFLPYQSLLVDIARRCASKLGRWRGLILGFRVCVTPQFIGTSSKLLGKYFETGLQFLFPLQFLPVSDQVHLETPVKLHFLGHDMLLGFQLLEHRFCSCL